MAFSHDGIGASLLALGRAREAVAELDQALKLERTAEPAMRGDTRFALARALQALRKDPARARELASQARADFEAASRPEKARDVAQWLEAAR
jgi:hypothetical protein